MAVVASRLGGLLVREKLVAPAQLEQALIEAQKNQQSLVDVLLAQNIIDEQNLIEFLSKQYRLTVMDLSSFTLDAEVGKLMPGSLCQKYNVIPVGRRQDTLVVATADPTNIQMLDDIRFQTKLRVELVLALPSVIRALLTRNYSNDLMKLAASVSTEGVDVVDMEAENDEQAASNTEDAPIVAFVTAVLTDAIQRGASDIHIEPYDNDLRVRLRIDGDLLETAKPPPQVKAALVARIKVMAQLRIDEKRLPQDGRVRIKLGDGRKVDFRVNTLPTVYGEKVVMRILDKSNVVLDLDKLGFEKDDLEKFMTAARRPWGMCLVTGATGSGKTTTLYGVLGALNTPDVNISTIEDPVEYNFSGINQTQAKEAIGLTFAEALRALLRQDPDIILLGEIRDSETAEVAMKAALTGHMVLSTLHTNDAPSTIMRLKDIGVDAFLINAAVHAIVAQRLVRTVCSKCKAPDPRWSDEMLLKMGFPQSVMGKFQPMKGTGCKTCNGTGMKGRAAIHEILVMSDALREAIGRNATTLELKKIAIQNGMRTLRANCMRKVIRGITTVEELQALGAE